MQFWQVVSWCETAHFVEVARMAEDCGFDGVIIAEHVFYPEQVSSPYPYSADGRSPMSDTMEFPEPLIAFAAAASVTQRLQFMTGVYLPALRHPLEMARNTATLSVICQGRFRFGIGSGWLREEYEQMGVDFNSRGRRLDESIALWRQLWSGDAVSHHGEFFQLEKLRVRPAAYAPIPVIGGGSSAPALRRAAQLCDGWYGAGNRFEELPAIIARLCELRAASNQDWNSFEIIAPLLDPLDAARCHAMEQLGVHGTVNFPFLFGLGPDSSLASKQRWMEDYAERVIVPARARAPI